jgi:hypothetical protein
LAAKGEDKKEEVESSLNRVGKNIYFSFAFVNFPTNMSYSLALGSKEVHTTFNMWGPKISNNTTHDKSKHQKHNISYSITYSIISS